MFGSSEEDKQEVLLQQYQGIRETILANVKTIGKMVDQAKGLQKIAETIQEGDIKTSVEQQVKNIQNLIDQLIIQTQDFFDKYEDFVRKAFPQ